MSKLQEVKSANKANYAAAHAAGDAAYTAAWDAYWEDQNKQVGESELDRLGKAFVIARDAYGDAYDADYKAKCEEARLKKQQKENT